MKLTICFALGLLFASCSTQQKLTATLGDAPAHVAADGNREVASVAGQPTCQPCADGGHYKVHLTFDDGPYKTLSNAILKTLQAKQVHATFFELYSAYSPLQSEKALSNFDDATPAQLAQISGGILKGGHILACHTLEHIDHVQLDIPEAKALANIRRGIELSPIGSAKLLRLPYGRGWYKEAPGSEEARRAASLMALIHQLGYQHVGWDIDSFDWSKEFHQKQPAALLSDICSARGGIVLMHDIQPYEARNLASEIDLIRCSGHELVDFETIKAENRIHPMTSFQDRADYAVVKCPGGLRGIKDGVCLIKPKAFQR